MKRNVKRFKTEFLEKKIKIPVNFKSHFIDVIGIIFNYTVVAQNRK
jgi:hypothetical protein